MTRVYGAHDAQLYHFPTRSDVNPAATTYFTVPSEFSFLQPVEHQCLDSICHDFYAFFNNFDDTTAALHSIAPKTTIPFKSLNESYQMCENYVCTKMMTYG